MSPYRDKDGNLIADDPLASYRPGSGKKYDPKDPHFNPMHPPEGYPKELLEKEWGETFDDDESTTSRD
jgi:hypothetical protein